jgi:ParB family chromosome partitioning protein
MPAKEKTKPRLKNLDDLFSLNGDVNPMESSVPIIETQPQYKRAVVFTAIDKLNPFKDHPFRLYDGERLDDMVASIKKNGVLAPIIVRQSGDGLEILSGHNRVEASRLAELEEVPAIIFDDISDEDAMVYVVETNLIQRSFSDMCHSEKAAVIALHHSKMFSQGKRNDVLAQLELLEKPLEEISKKPCDTKENETCGQVDHKLSTREKVAQDYNLASKTVARYLRINKLTPMLKTLLDSGNIAFMSAVTLSYLKEAEQEQLAESLERNNLSVDMKKADMLRKHSEKDRLDGESIYRILTGAMANKPSRTPTVKVSKVLYSKYFTPNQPAKEVQGIVEKALEMYFEQQ